MINAQKDFMEKRSMSIIYEFIQERNYFNVINIFTLYKALKHLPDKEIKKETHNENQLEINKYESMHLNI